jgi:hypothetical protein
MFIVWTMCISVQELCALFGSCLGISLQKAPEILIRKFKQLRVVHFMSHTCVLSIYRARNLMLLHSLSSSTLVLC